MGLKVQALITNIQGYSIHDGPGIRTVVFFKGCGLRCKWCANPECISGRAQTGFIKNLCTQCGRCLAACPHGAINAGEAAHRVDYSRCEGCGSCADACYYGALVRYGSLKSVEEVFEAVRRDKMFYADNGGLTVSGGEPLLYPEFVAELFELCRDDGISTCVETSGFVETENLLRVLPLTNYLLFDIKHLDSDLHKEWTAQPNELILANARLAAESGADILFRAPLVPGINDSVKNIEETAGFLRQIQRDPKVELMPYHRLGESKYKALGLSCELSGIDVTPREKVVEARDCFVSFGVGCSISE